MRAQCRLTHVESSKCRQAQFPIFEINSSICQVSIPYLACPIGGSFFFNASPSTNSAVFSVCSVVGQSLLHSRLLQNIGRLRSISFREVVELFWDA